MLYREGRKSFTMAKSVSNDIIQGRITRLRQIFQELVNKVIPQKCRTNVIHKKYRNCPRAAFYVTYGIRMYYPEKIHSILKEIATFSILLLSAEKYQEDTDKGIEKLGKQYEEYVKNKPKIEF